MFPFWLESERTAEESRKQVGYMERNSIFDLLYLGSNSKFTTWLCNQEQHLPTLRLLQSESKVYIKQHVLYKAPWNNVNIFLLGSLSKWNFLFSFYELSAQFVLSFFKYNQNINMFLVCLLHAIHKNLKNVKVSWRHCPSSKLH